MASIAEFSLVPKARGTKILPGKCTLTFGTETLRKRYETLSRLARLMSVGTPGDWISSLSTDLRNVLPFDLLEVIVCKNDGSEVQWRSPAASETHVKNVPMKEAVFGWVQRRQQPLWIADCDADEGCAVEGQRLKSLELGYRSFYGLRLRTPYRLLGIFGLASLQQNSFTTEDVEFLEQVAGQLSLAIDNWLAHSEIADLRDRVSQESVYVEDEIRTEMHFQGIIGRSAALRGVLKQVETVAPTNSSVLVFGETGTGKELIARAIHDFSPRRANAFVTLNCAAIPAGLLESELFGHERGAFTGAIAPATGVKSQV